jgi:acyl-coenzyme A synthetase/AMP-(fatty) acid ligase
MHAPVHGVRRRQPREYLRLAETDRILCVLPLAFDYGLYQLLMTIQPTGATLVLEQSFTYPAQIFARMQEQKVTVFPGVRRRFTPCSSRAMDARRWCSPMSAVITPPRCPMSSCQAARDLSECADTACTASRNASVNYLEPELADQNGPSGARSPYRNLSTVSGREAVPPGETGILYVRGPTSWWDTEPARPERSHAQARQAPGEHVPTRTSSAWTPRIHHFQGRSDDIIKTRGEKVSPVEVENALHSIPGGARPRWSAFQTRF